MIEGQTPLLHLLENHQKQQEGLVLLIQARGQRGKEMLKHLSLQGRTGEKYHAYTSPSG